MIDYSTTVSTIIEKAKTANYALPIRNEQCLSKFFFHSHPTPKVCLFFHGFTAGPYQFEPLGNALFQAGYNVLVPLMPGHGVAGHWNGDNPPPLPTDIQVYQQFVLEWLQQVIPLGKQVILGGYSTGGTLAAWLAQNSPQFIEKTLLFAPYLSSNTILIDWLVQTLPFYYEWLNKDNPGNFGYNGFCIPALEVLLDLGQQVLERAEITSATPILMVSSESDRATNLDAQRDLFEAVLNYQPQSWYYCFKRELNIPHTMMTEAEGNNYLSLLLDLTKAYVDSHQTWTEVQEQGLPF